MLEKTKYKIAAFTNTLVKYVKGAVFGALVVIALNSYELVVKVHLDPQFRVVEQERMDKLK